MILKSCFIAFALILIVWLGATARQVGLMTSNAVSVALSSGN